MLVSTRADAASHSLREPYRLPHGGVVCPMGCEGAPHGYIGGLKRLGIYCASVLRSKVHLGLSLLYTAFRSSSGGTAYLHPFSIAQAQAIHHGAYRYCVDVRPSRTVAPSGASGCRWPHGHRQERQSLWYRLLCMHWRVSLMHEPSLCRSYVRLTCQSLLYGYNQGVFGGVLVMKAFERHMGSYTEDSSKMGWLVSILELGAWLGTIYSGFLAEIISRKYAILVNTGIFILGVIIQATAITGTGHNSILGGRFITGVSVCVGSSRHNALTLCRYGGRITVYDRANVQRGVRTPRSPRRYGRYAADGNHYWHHDRFLDRLW